MALGERINRFFMNSEWRLSLVLTMVGIVSSFALPAWAVRATNLFADYSPFSWVAAGFIGFLLFAFGYFLIAHARSKWVRSRYDHNLYKRTGFVDPMAATFENKRIFLSDFILPSDPHIEGKTFINCEIIGPANLFFRNNNRVDEHRLPVCDGIVIQPGKPFLNGVFLDGCAFRKCSFKRVTVVLLPEMYQHSRNVDWLNWIAVPDEQPDIPGLEISQGPNSEHRLPPSTGEETPR